MSEKKDPAILRAERLRAIQAMPEYQQTIAEWLKTAKEAALHDLATVQDPNGFFKAQGAYGAIESLLQQFDRVYIAEEAVLNKKTKHKDQNLPR